MWVIGENFTQAKLRKYSVVKKSKTILIFDNFLWGESGCME